MLPSDLSENSFQSYPPKARQLATENLALLRQLPLGFTPFLLKEVIASDWKFPAEKRELNGQLAYLNGLSKDQLQKEMAHFAALKLTEKFAAFDWVNAPGQFLEQLSAHLWATHQMDGFRSASEEYVRRFYASMPATVLAAPPLGIVVIGQGVAQTQYPLFRKLRKEGVYFKNVNAEHGLAHIMESLKQRAAEYPLPYGHWYIDGGRAGLLPGIKTVGYEELKPVRSALADKMLAAFGAPRFDPEMLRSDLARTSMENLGMASSGDAALDHFQLSLLTEGSGTQVYSTSFVQWGAREALRRAQPITLCARYAPRQREQSMDELLTGVKSKAATDPHGSLIDADMGAYYTWLNQRRLAGSEKAGFIAWFEGHGEAVAIGPGLPRGVEDASSMDIPGLLKKIS